jgi:hypothetical protein
MDCWKVLLTASVILFATASARAANLEVRERQAKRACMLGDTKKGVELLTDLYLDTNDATYIFNQARCYEQNGQGAQAILRFQEYLRKEKKISPALADEVKKRIDGLQARSAGNDKAMQSDAVPGSTLTRPPEPTQSSTASTIPSSAAPATESLGIAQIGQAPEPQESPPAYKRWWFWTGIGAVVAGGVVTAVLLSSKSAAQSPACHPGGICVP